MTKTDQLLLTFAQSLAAGGGIQTTAELAFMLGEKNSSAFNKFLAGEVKKGRLRRLGHGIYESRLTPPDPNTAIYQIIHKMRKGVLNYISLESQLSYSSVISQVVMERVTVISKGRSGTFVTPYGIIEITHTKKSVHQLASQLYFDPEIKMYRATTEQAILDLKSCRRNLQMLEP